MTNITMPAKTRQLLLQALQEEQTMRAMLQQHQKSIDTTIEIIRDLLQVPSEWILDNSLTTFVPPSAAPTAPE